MWQNGTAGAGQFQFWELNLPSTPPGEVDLSVSVRRGRICPFFGWPKNREFSIPEALETLRALLAGCDISGSRYRWVRVDPATEAGLLNHYPIGRLR